VEVSPRGPLSGDDLDTYVVDNETDMALYPDLAACGIRYMHFAFHIGGGLAAIDDFWAKRGVDISSMRVLFAGYTRDRQPHAVWVQWVRSHEECCDVYLGFDLGRPTAVWPRLPAARHRLRENDLREFLEFAAKLQGLGRVQARYAFPSAKNLDTLFPFPAEVRPVSFTLEVLGEGGKPAMHVTYERAGTSWLAIVAPTARFKIADEPVRDTFFKAPYETACLLAKSFQGQEQP
jgi:hypothetical protein